MHVWSVDGLNLFHVCMMFSSCCCELAENRQALGWGTIQNLPRTCKRDGVLDSSDCHSLYVSSRYPVLPTLPLCQLCLVQNDVQCCSYNTAKWPSLCHREKEEAAFNHSLKFIPLRMLIQKSSLNNKKKTLTARLAKAASNSASGNELHAGVCS